MSRKEAISIESNSEYYQDLIHNVNTLSIANNSTIDGINVCDAELLELKNKISREKIKTLVYSADNAKLVDHLHWLCPELDTIICVNSSDKKKIVQKPLLGSKMLWDFVGTRGNDMIEVSGFYNSYDGDKFTEDEIREYVENVYLKLKSNLNSHSRVLDVGCAGGLIANRISKSVDSYYAVDQSQKILDKTKEFLDLSLRNVELKCISANQIESITDRKFDTIIINSVVQYFTSLNYLRDVIRQCIEVIDGEGIIFLGDLMDLEKKSDLENEMIAYKNIKQNSVTKTDWSNELFIHKDFINNLISEFSKIVETEVSTKYHTIENELTKYRFDAILHVCK